MSDTGTTWEDRQREIARQERLRRIADMDTTFDRGGRRFPNPNSPTAPVPRYDSSVSTFDLPGSIPSSTTFGQVLGGGTMPGQIGLGPNASTSELESYIRQRYGYMAGFMNIPEVRNTLLEAARNGWGPEELYGAISQTSWWRSTSAAARTWQQLTSEDPAEAQRMVGQVAANVADVANQYGLRLSAGQITDLAYQSLKHGWASPEGALGTQAIDSILRNIDWEVLEGGTITDTRDRMKALAGQYMIRLSEQSAREYAERIARGELTEEGVRSMFQQKAVARYSYMAPLIEQGVTPADYFAQSRDVVASTLEVSPDSIDMMDPKWLGLLEVRDVASGELRAATQNEAMLAARRQPEFVRTRGAQELMASMATGLSAAMGRAS